MRIVPAVMCSAGFAILTAAPHAQPQPAREPSLALDTRPLLAQRTPILDVAIAPDGARLIVLEPDQVSLRRVDAAGDASDVVEQRAVQTARIWPRDLRGRIDASHVPFDVFLPGVTCRGGLDPLRISCADETAPWPGLANSGVEAARNYFTTPEGRPFSSAAPLPAGAQARWLVADRQGGLLFFDDKRSPVGRPATAGDDVAAAYAACSAGPFVVVSNRVARDAAGAADPADVDELRLFRVAGRELVSSATPLRLPGILTALWDAVAIVHDVATDRYEAFRISVSCAR
ncbi:MAG TPA: hypothetical protein VKH42_06425 [Vicinamibacterales bacterium]|nr:hypothetical protein [Vicinamibacterales bacterium]